MPRQLFDVPENELSELLSQRVSKDVLKFFIDTYSKEGYYYNNNFQPWIPKQRYDGKPTLYKSGHMKSNFMIDYPSRTSFVISNPTPYAIYHQEGLGHNPERPILYDDNKVREIMKESILTQLNKLF